MDLKSKYDLNDVVNFYEEYSGNYGWGEITDIIFIDEGLSDGVLTVKYRILCCFSEKSNGSFLVYEGDIKNKYLREGK